MNEILRRDMYEDASGGFSPAPMPAGVLTRKLRQGPYGAEGTHYGKVPHRMWVDENAWSQ
jgi:hypothetical protein